MIHKMEEIIMSHSYFSYFSHLVYEKFIVFLRREYDGLDALVKDK